MQIRRMVNTDELLGTTETAELLGWSRQRVATYYREQRAGMPQPVARLKGTPVWVRGDILAWARRRGYPLPADGQDPTDTPPATRRSRATRRAQDGRKRGGRVADTAPPG